MAICECGVPPVDYFRRPHLFTRGRIMTRADTGDDCIHTQSGLSNDSSLAAQLYIIMINTLGQLVYSGRLSGTHNLPPFWTGVKYAPRPMNSGCNLCAYLIKGERFLFSITPALSWNRPAVIRDLRSYLARMWLWLFLFNALCRFI